MDFQSRFYLLRRHLLTVAILAIDADTLPARLARNVRRHAAIASPSRGGRVSRLLGRAHIHFPGQFRVLFHLLFRVPEPFVYLVLFEVELGGEFGDLVARGRLPLELLVELPERLFLTLGLPGPIFHGVSFRLFFVRWGGFSVGRGRALPFELHLGVCFDVALSVLGRALATETWLDEILLLVPLLLRRAPQPFESFLLLSRLLQVIQSRLVLGKAHHRRKVVHAGRLHGPFGRR